MEYSKFFACLEAQKKEARAAYPNGEWQKKMHIRQNVPDNFLDASFLMNLTMREYNEPNSFWQISSNTLSFMEHISFITLYVVIWHTLKAGILSSLILMYANMAMFAIGHFSRSSFFSRYPIEASTDWNDFRSIFGIIGCLWMLSPVLETLTAHFTDFSVQASSAFMFTLHVTLYDYGDTYQNSPITAKYTGNSISLNSAMFASVLLASRLPNATLIFLFLCSGIQILSFNPLVRGGVHARSDATKEYPPILLMKMLPVFCTSFVSLFFLDKIFGIFYLVSLLFVTLAFPFLLMYYSSKYKIYIKGPWDVAKIDRAEEFLMRIRQERKSMDSAKSSL
ncbi:phosphatidylinositol n-acetylglucosaminyltransferase [Cardiosporidium cionae]|uniref:Phosphatidylinositol n-acetylglucosaminyltransferase n=1 Tax=Cardiosporidium cionae TaxID=476202 RepID=A0ABQ7JAN2_9APIC|nr:phosphatidylinositol n-acetylglucosaminyltransferase [Cardiosporidium cionae]|eukprot:KAF8821046.1 phosphatidylinositol n-acetylglucosaminyltransferase [Cardiosporidium cionae]